MNTNNQAQTEAEAVGKPEVPQPEPFGPPLQTIRLNGDQPYVPKSNQREEESRRAWDNGLPAQDCSLC